MVSSHVNTSMTYVMILMAQLIFMSLEFCLLIIGVQGWTFKKHLGVPWKYGEYNLLYDYCENRFIFLLLKVSTSPEFFMQIWNLGLEV